MLEQCFDTGLIISQWSANQTSLPTHQLTFVLLILDDPATAADTETLGSLRAGPKLCWQTPAQIYIGG